MEQGPIKAVAIVCAKRNSIRFKDKNYTLAPDVIMRLMKCRYLDKIVVATDDERLIEELKIYNKKVHIVTRPLNACVDNDSVFTVSKWAYMSLDERYDYVSVVLPNVTGFSQSFLGYTLKLLRKNKLKEVRTYGEDGIENGIITMTEKYFLRGRVSTYCGAVFTKAKEVHTRQELF